MTHFLIKQNFLRKPTFPSTFKPFIFIRNKTTANYIINTIKKIPENHPKIKIDHQRHRKPTTSSAQTKPDAARVRPSTPRRKRGVEINRPNKTTRTERG